MAPLRHDPRNGALLLGETRLLALPVEAVLELWRSAEPQGQRFADELVASAGYAAGEAIAALVAEGAPQAVTAAFCAEVSGLGLGTFRVAALDAAARAIDVEVAGSPFAAALAPAEGPCCHLLRGAVAALGARVFGIGAASEEVACAAAGAPLCRFRVRGVQVADEESWSW
jgi:predicted hydrocarbon binding protein